MFRAIIGSIDYLRGNGCHPLAIFDIKMAEGKTPKWFERVWKSTRTWLSDGKEHSDISDQVEKKKLLFDPTVIKAFLAGVVISHLSKNLLVGVLVGTLSGIYVQQNVSGVPSVTDSWKEFLKRFEDTRSKKK